MASIAHRTAILRGKASEARVTADLFDRGFSVFASMANFGQGDVVAVKDGRCWLIEVKSGRVQANGRLHHGKGSGRKAGYDVLAVVTKDKRIVYDPWDWEGPPDAIRSPRIDEPGAGRMDIAKRAKTQGRAFKGHLRGLAPCSSSCR